MHYTPNCFLCGNPIGTEISLVFPRALPQTNTLGRYFGSAHVTCLYSWDLRYEFFSAWYEISCRRVPPVCNVIYSSKDVWLAANSYERQYLLRMNLNAPGIHVPLDCFPALASWILEDNAQPLEFQENGATIASFRMCHVKETQVLEFGESFCFRWEMGPFKRELDLALKLALEDATAATRAKGRNQ